VGRPAGWMQKLTGRGAMRSPGAPSHRNEMEQRFWMEVATGVTSEEAAEMIGVSPAVGTRWFRHRGGMPLFMAKPVSGRSFLQFHHSPPYTGVSEIEGRSVDDLPYGFLPRVANVLDLAPLVVSLELNQRSSRVGKAFIWPTEAMHNLIVEAIQ
jgi:hypothetical protein